jgi:hypothetical protein
MVPFWAYTELSSAPILASVYLVATLVQRMLFIALMTKAKVSSNIFLPSGWLLVNVQVNTPYHTQYMHTSLFLHHIHAQHLHILLYMFSALLGRLSTLGS